SCKAAHDTAAWLQFCLNHANLIQHPKGFDRLVPARRITSRPGCTSKKWPPKKGGHSCVEKTVLDCLPLEVAPRHAKRTERRPEQHYRGAAVRNSAGPAKERPTGKPIPFPSLRN